MLFMGVSVPDAANVCNESKVESYDTDIKYCPEFYAENEKENTTESDSDINSDIFEDDSVIGSLNEITKDKSDVTFYDIYVVLCQYLVQVKMRNFSHFNPPEAQPQCVFFHTIVRIHLVTYSYNGYEFVSYCRKLPDIRKSSGMLAYNHGF